MAAIKKQNDANGTAVWFVNAGMKKSVANPIGATTPELTRNKRACIRLRFISDSRHHRKKKNKKEMIIMDKYILAVLKSKLF